MDSTAPAISVIMPVHNAERYLAAAIESILQQTFTDFEFIIINDGSTDKSLQIMRDYAAKDSRIQVISRGNLGLIETLNEGARTARSQLLARMDADDISHPERFKKQYEYLQVHSAHVAVGCKVYLIDNDGDLMCPYSLGESHETIDAAHLQGKGGAITHPAAMFRKKQFEAIGSYKKEYPHAEDLDLWLRMAEVGKLANLPDLLFSYRQHVQSIGYSKRKEQLASANKAVKDALKRRNIAFESQPTIHEEPAIDEAGILLKWAWWALSAGNVKTARKYAIKLFKKQPLSLDTLKICFYVLRGY